MLEISNKQLRAIWLERHLLSKNPVGPLDVMQIIKDLGFVQIDTIQNVVRAHHHILWSRNQNYRSKKIDKHLGRAGDLFEHFTHDASMLPTEFFPFWRRRFAQMEARLKKWDFYARPERAEEAAEILERIEQEGALSTEAFDTKIEGEKQMWDRPPHKKLLDYLWYSGELATSHRVGFRKHYDLPQRVVPAQHLQNEVSDLEQINWLCHAALNRMGLGTASDIKKFWEAVSPSEVKAWLDSQEFEKARVQLADKSWTEVFCAPDLTSQLQKIEKPTSRLRILNPFDPAIRDRKRLLKYFGFDYTIEIFVPADKRQWGYYVYPLLQGDRFVGRIELKADRKADTLCVAAFWTEPNVRWTDARHNALDRELNQFAKFGGLADVAWHCDRDQG